MGEQFGLFHLAEKGCDNCLLICVAEKIIFKIQWGERKENTGVQFQQRRFRSEISKILNDKGLSALFQIPR